MVSAFDSESIGPGLSPGQGQVYKWVPANLMLRGNPLTDEYSTTQKKEMATVKI